MARIEGGLGAKKRHNRVLKLAVNDAAGFTALADAAKAKLA